eukprot:COSAG03_NODE_6018_length_1129_cov_80.624272_1_plen_177_part_00
MEGQTETDTERERAAHLPRAVGGAVNELVVDKHKVAVSSRAQICLRPPLRARAQTHSHTRTRASARASSRARAHTHRGREGEKEKDIKSHARARSHTSTGCIWRTAASLLAAEAAAHRAVSSKAASVFSGAEPSPPRWTITIGSIWPTSTAVGVDGARRVCAEPAGCRSAWCTFVR